MKNQSTKNRSKLERFKIEKDQKGITLFELMAVICIIGVLSSIGIVSFKPLWQKHQLNLSTNMIEEQIHLLRLKAIIENSTYEMKFNHHYLIFRKKNNEGWDDWRKYLLNSAVDCSMSGSIYFDQKGFASPKTITIKTEHRFQKLIININGRIRKSEII